MMGIILATSEVLSLPSCFIIELPRPPKHGDLQQRCMDVLAIFLSQSVPLL